MRIVAHRHLWSSTHLMRCWHWESRWSISKNSFFSEKLHSWNSQIQKKWMYLCVDYIEIGHCLVTLSYLPCAYCFVSACVKFAHEFLTLFERLVQLIFSFPSWFHTIWFYCSHSFLLQIILCFSFGSKDMITCLLYAAGIFLLEAYLQSYCQWPIIELTKNVSPSLA